MARINKNEKTKEQEEQQEQALDLFHHNQILANAELHGMGFEIFGEKEFVRYPVIGVNQPTSDYKPEGKFHNRITGEVYDTVSVVFLSLRRSMAFRPNGYSDPIPVCYSSDALRPDTAVEQPMHHACHRAGVRGLIPECPNARWIRTSDGKSRRPCDLKYTAAVDLDGEHYLVYFHGRSIAPLENFISQMRQFRQPLFGLRVTLELTYRTKKEGFMGNFYEINFPDLPTPADRERVEIINALNYQDAALFFKEYFEAAPSDIYHEEHHEENADNGVAGEGVRYLQGKSEEDDMVENWGARETDL